MSRTIPYERIDATNPRDYTPAQSTISFSGGNVDGSFPRSASPPAPSRSPSPTSSPSSLIRIRDIPAGLARPQLQMDRTHVRISTNSLTTPNSPSAGRFVSGANQINGSQRTLDLDGIGIERRGRERKTSWSETDIFVKHKTRTSRYCCGCFTSRKWCCAIWLTIIFLFLCALGYSAFVFYPRIPNIDIGTPYIPFGLPGNGMNFTRNDKGQVEQITIYMEVNVTINSVNNWDYFLSEISANGNLLDINLKPISNAAGNGSLSDVTIFSNSVNTFVFPLQVYWNYIGLGLLADPALETLVNCTLAKPPATFRAEYTFQATIPLVSWTGYSLKETGQFQFNIATLPTNQKIQLLSIVQNLIAQLL